LTSNTVRLRGVSEADGSADAAIYTMSTSCTCFRLAGAVDVCMIDFQTFRAVFQHHIYSQHDDF